MTIISILNTNETRSKLSILLNDFCKRTGLPHWSADELAAEFPLHRDVLSAFGECWNFVDKFDDEERASAKIVNYWEDSEKCIDAENDIAETLHDILINNPACLRQFDDCSTLLTTPLRYNALMVLLLEYTTCLLFVRQPALDVIEEKTISINNEDSPSAPFTFEFQGMAIHNPYIDDSARYEVDPVKHYGAVYVNWYYDAR